MQAALARLRVQLGSDSAYFAKVYTHTFDFARAEGQRSLGERLSFLFPVSPIPLLSPYRCWALGAKQRGADMAGQGHGR